MKVLAVIVDFGTARAIRTAPCPSLSGAVWRDFLRLEDHDLWQGKIGAWYLLYLGEAR